MNSDEIRKTFIKDIADSLVEGKGIEQQIALAIMGCGRALVEIAAQLADLNENIKAKSMTAHCDAHVHLSETGYDSGAGLP